MAVPLGLSAGWGQVQDLAGKKPTVDLGVRGTDLGYFFEGGEGKWVGSIFGDSFAHGKYPGDGSADGGGWMSPVILRTSNRDVVDKGVKWDNAVGAFRNHGKAVQVWDYAHIGENNPAPNTNDAFTIIPNDVIQLPNGFYFGNGFRVRDWKIGGDQQMCHTHGVAWFWSNEQNADAWQPARHTGDLGRLYQWPNSGREHFFQNNSMLMLPGDDHVYVFGSPEGRKIGATSGIYLRRCLWDRLTDDRAWEFWAFTHGRWGWSAQATPTPILRPVTPNGAIGELNVQLIGGKVVLTYSDAVLGAVAYTAPRPDAVWAGPIVLVGRLTSPTQYAPSVHPWSTLDRAFLHLSSWKRLPNPLGFLPGQPKESSVEYGAFGYRVSLEAQIPKPRKLTMNSPTLGADAGSLDKGERESWLSSVVDASREAGNASS